MILLDSVERRDCKLAVLRKEEDGYSHGEGQKPTNARSTIPAPIVVKSLLDSEHHTAMR